MLIGTMNHPARDIVEEIHWMAEAGLEFVDLSLEPPVAASWNADAPKIRATLERYGLPVVGHTAFYLPMASPFESVRKAAVEELRRCLDVFSDIGARWMNLHPDHYAPFQDRSFFVARNLDSLNELLPHSRSCGVGLMVENLPGEFNNPAQLGDLFDPLPEIGLHLDFGHANLLVPHNSADDILAKYGDRLRHVHLHDNKGGHEDRHAPLGTGNVDVKHTVEALKRCGYDGTITLEVFTPDRHYLSYSRDVLRRVWEETGSIARGSAG